MNDPVKAKIIELVPEIASLPKYPYSPEAAEACVKLASMFSLKHFTPDMQEMASAHILAYQDQQKSDYIKMLEGRWTGRPITLADVLRAIATKAPHPARYEMWTDASSFDAPSLVIQKSGSEKDEDISAWNLTTDYDGQTQEVKDFIGSLFNV